MEGKRCCQKRAQGRPDWGVLLVELGSRASSSTYIPASYENANDEASMFQTRSWTSASQLGLI